MKEQHLQSFVGFVGIFFHTTLVYLAVDVSGISRIQI